MEAPDQPPSASRVDDDHGSAYALLRDGTSEDAAGADDTGRLVPLTKLFAFADTTDRVLMALGALGGVVAGASGPVQMVLLGDVLNAFNPAVGSSTAAIRDDINELALSFVIVGVAAFVGGFLEVACWSVAASRQARRLRGAYVGALLAQEIGWFDVHSPSQLAARAADAAVAIQDGMGSKVGDALRFLAMGVAGVAIGLVKGWQLTLLLLAFTPFVALATYASVRVVAKATRASLEAYGVAGAVALEALANVRTVHMLNAIDHFTAKYEAALNGATRAGVRQGLATGWGQGLQYFAIFCTYAVGLFFGAYKVGQDQLGSFDERCTGDGCYDGGRVITVFMCVVMGAMSLGSAGPCLRALYAARAAAVDVFDLIERQSHIDALAGDGVTLPTVSGHVELHDVTFAYPSRPDVSVCRHYSLAIRAGETIAFVGASGSGKSTVVALLQRFYDPQSGVVKLDGTDVREMNVHWLREQIGLVGQEPALFATTVMDNIRHGRPSATDEEVAEAARLADALSFIKALPKGFETEVGERGAQLSGGQKQRIAIARAVLKNPPVLLLDEATSALDAESEYAVQTALDKLCANTHRTTIVVAHRLSTVRSADRIAFHADGAITELGSHDELMRIPGGQYRAMVELQQTRDDDQAVDERAAQPDSSQITLVVAADTNAGNNRQPTMTVGDTEPERTDTSLSELEAWKIPTRRIWRQALPEWRYMVVGGIGAVVSAAMYPTWAVLLTKLTVLYFRLDYTRHELLVHAGYWSLGFLGVAVVFGVCMTLQHFGFGVVAQRTVARVRAAVFSAMLRQEIAWFDRDENASGALAAQLASDAGVLQAVTTDTLNQRLVNATTLVLGLSVCFYYSWRLTLLIVATTPLFVFASYMELKQAKVGSNNKTGNDADAAAGALLAEAIGSIRTVVSFGLERTIAASYTALLSASSAVDTRAGLVTGASFGTSLCVLFFVISFLVWLGGRWFAEGTESFEDFMMVFTVVMFSALAVGMAAQSSTPMDKIHAATFRLFSVMDREPMIDSTTRDLALVGQSIRGDIHFNHVSFNYPSRPDTRVYNSYDLRIAAGQTVAIVGASGSGKSTAISLLERFYDPSAGSITLDGSDIRQLSLPWLRERISLVSQEPVLFAGTIAENIAMGKPGATRDEVVDAAKKANAFDFISNFPDGFDTDVGDRGAQVSGGQKQRIAIARAILRDPEVLLLDEATSALDNESERVVQASLDALLAARRCTTIVVAHRLSTIRNADVIAVTDGGRVVELGTHGQLMAVDDGAYRSLVARQVEL